MIQNLNSIQKYFKFVSPEIQSNFNAIQQFGRKSNLYLNLIPEDFYKNQESLNIDLIACISKYPLAFDDGNSTRFNHFSCPGLLNNRFMFISTDLLKGFTSQAGCTFEKGITYIIASQLIVYFTELGYHKETRGCVMDYCENRADMVLGLKQKRLCPNCRSSIANDNLLEAIDAMLINKMIV